MKTLHQLILILCCVSIASCIKEPQIILVTGITLNSSSLTLTEGETARLTATISPSNADNQRVIWSSSNASVASVSNGTITAVSAGLATITAKSDDGGKTATCNITVNSKKIAVTGVSLDKSSLELTEGDEYTLVATVQPANADNKKVIWTSSDNTVASVDGGKVKALRQGSTTITAKTDEGGMTAICRIKVKQKVGSGDPFTITSTGSTSVSIAKNGDPSVITLEYKKGASDWASYQIGSLISLSDGEFVLFRAGANGNPRFANSSSNYYCFKVAGEGTISVSGNIMSLVDRSLHQNYLSDMEFYRLFYFCRKLTDASKLILPVTILSYNCYKDMFYGCSSLISAPELPATSLADFCYARMFGDCNSLISAPELPATSLAYCCYETMFCYCTSLVDAPILPATTLAEGCYFDMFLGCTSLVNAPELPATSLADFCYERMFDGCSSLISAPELPATSLAELCYYEMFCHCTSLVDAPILPATTLAEACYYSMFKYCTSLINAPELPATSLADRCYGEMFLSCTSLLIAPDLPATKLKNGCYSNMFTGCSRLSYVKSYATNPSSNNCHWWLVNVSSTGTFVKKDGVSWTRGIDGIPPGWTVISE